METFVRDRAQVVAMHVGHHIRLARQMRKMTQGQLAEQINLTFQQVQKYERGSNRVSVPTLVLISQILAVPISYFFEGLHKIDSERDEQLTAFGVDGTAMALFLRTSASPASA